MDTLMGEDSIAPTWRPARQKTAAAEIVTQIREALFAGRLAPGDFLGSDRSMSQQFGVSRVTMRDALRALETSGIVEIRLGAHGGVWVAQPNPQHFAEALAVQLKLAAISRQELIDAQSGIEVIAAERAAAAATPEDIARLRDAIAEVIAQRGKRQTFSEATLRFHLCVFEASHNRALLALFEAIAQVWMMYLPVATREIEERVISYYNNLVEAIAARDSSAAGALVATFLAERRRAARALEKPRTK